MCWQDVRDVVLSLAAGFAAGKLTHSRRTEYGYAASAAYSVANRLE